MMTGLLFFGVLFTLMLGFGVSGLVVNTKLVQASKPMQGVSFVLMGSVLSVFVFALMIFIVWPAKIVV